MRWLVISGAVLVASCHLADDPDPPTCGAGTHANRGRCVADALGGPTVTIAAGAGGTSCVGDVATQRPPSVSPEAINVKVGGEFRFKNEDVVAHEVRGADDQVWLSANPGELSGFFAITKPGAWAYRVSGCAKGGTVVVE